MTLRIYALDDIFAIAPEGRLDYPAARAIEEAFAELFDQRRVRVVVDLSSVHYVASAGLKVLLGGLRRARQLGGDVRLAGLTDRVREVFEIAGFDEIFAADPTVEDAVRGFNAPA